MNDKAAGLWEKDMTGLKVRDRFDVQAVDEGAVVKGEITVTISTTDTTDTTDTTEAEG